MSKSLPPEVKAVNQRNQLNFSKFFDEADKLIRQYHQSATGLQCECLASHRKIVESAFSFQKNFLGKSNGDAPFNETLQEIMHESSDAASKVLATQNQIMTNMIEIARQSLKAINDNSHGIADLNSTMMQSWMFFWNPKQN
ncbi:MAG: hypothetical protein ACREBB_02760 [Nitrosotalea sp.]